VRLSYTNSSTNSTRISYGPDAGQAASSARSGTQPSRLRFMRFSQVACRPRIAQRTVVRLEFDTVMRAKLPESVRFVPRVPPTHSGDGA
jgi:hypothetical protein